MQDCNRGCWKYGGGSEVLSLGTSSVDSTPQTIWSGLKYGVSFLRVARFQPWATQFNHTSHLLISLDWLLIPILIAILCCYSLFLIFPAPHALITFST